MAAPLADRLRPDSLDTIVGQRHLLAPGKALRRIIESGDIPNLIFYGPSGVGKTDVYKRQGSWMIELMKNSHQTVMSIMRFVFFC